MTRTQKGGRRMETRTWLTMAKDPIKGPNNWEFGSEIAMKREPQKPQNLLLIVPFSNRSLLAEF